jgi:hypothetical protein
MNQAVTGVEQRILWQALTKQQQQQLLSLLGKWILQYWQKTAWPPSRVPSQTSGGCHEQQRQTPA